MCVTGILHMLWSVCYWHITHAPRIRIILHYITCALIPLSSGMIATLNQRLTNNVYNICLFSKHRIVFFIFNLLLVVIRLSQPFSSSHTRGITPRGCQGNMLTWVIRLDKPPTTASACWYLRERFLHEEFESRLVILSQMNPNIVKSCTEWIKRIF